MGYSHYLRREPELDVEAYDKVVVDFKKILPKLNEVIPLAGPMGDGEPIIDSDCIAFNGLEKCGHTVDESLHITWPTETAGGIANDTEDVKKGRWFAGAKIEKRKCGGDCSHETFRIERVYEPHGSWDEPKDGMYFSFCKTAFKPYDLAVIACLIIMKKHFGETVRISSDGTDHQWFDGKLLCQMELGYGMEFKINDAVLEEGGE